MPDVKHPIDRMETMPLDELTPYHKNPRRGDIDELARSLERNGQYKPIVVNLGRKTGRPLEIIAGNHTYAAAKRLGWDDLTVVTVDVDDVEAARIVAVDNRIGERGTNDDNSLTELLEYIQANSTDGLEGTGYDLDDLSQLYDSLEPEPGEDAPLLENGIVVQYAIIFDDEAQQGRWYGFLRWLKDNYEGETVAARLDAYLDGLGVASDE